MSAIQATRKDWHHFAGKKVLITGASGFLAGYMVEYFAWLNEQALWAPLTIYALGRNHDRLRAKYPHLAGRVDFVPIIQDVCTAMTEIGQIDFIVHAASPASPKYYLQDPVGTARANTLGTMNVLDLARTSRARLLFLSSGTVYGQGGDAKSIAETDFGPLDPLDPRACYSEGKRLGEALCAAYARQYDVAACIARISHTYGPGVALDDGRVFADFVADVVAGRDISLTGDGMDSRPFCYVADATAGLLTLLLHGEPSAAYNVGMDKEMTIFQLAKLLARLAPRPGTRVILPASDNVVRANVRSTGHFDISKLGSLGWRPLTTTEVGFERTLRYFLNR
jgi:nucleoside-diphosphate-sugar epimerase